MNLEASKYSPFLLFRSRCLILHCPFSQHAHDFVRSSGVVGSAGSARCSTEGMGDSLKDGDGESVDVGVSGGVAVDRENWEGLWTVERERGGNVCGAEDERGKKESRKSEECWVRMAEAG